MELIKILTWMIPVRNMLSWTKNRFVTTKWRSASVKPMSQWLGCICTSAAFKSTGKTSHSHMTCQCSRAPVASVETAINTSNLQREAQSLTHTFNQVCGMSCGMSFNRLLSNLPTFTSETDRVKLCTRTTLKRPRSHYLPTLCSPQSLYKMYTDNWWELKRQTTGTKAKCFADLSNQLKNRNRKWRQHSILCQTLHVFGT